VGNLLPTTREEDLQRETHRCCCCSCHQSIESVCHLKAQIISAALSYLQYKIPRICTHRPEGCSKLTTNACYREIFAQFVDGVKESEAQWYSIKPLHNDIPSLTDLMEASSENLQTLLVKAGGWFWKVGTRQEIDELLTFQIRKLSFGVYNSRGM
jgi:hypothetical protein